MPSPSASSPVLSPALVFLLAGACGLIAANLYYPQPLIGLIAPELGLSRSAESLIVTATQLGFCAGLVFLVPLGDLLENRRLVVTTLCGATLALMLAALAPSAAPFLIGCLLVGMGSVAVQMIVPITAHFTPEASRGRVVGQVMSGLLTGIMLARPVAGLVAGSFGWRALFLASGLLMLVLAGVLWRLLPQRRPQAGLAYGSLIGSLWTLMRDTPLLRRRAAYQAAMFGAFSLFWTAVPLELMGPRFGLGAHGVAWFSLAGAAGAVSAPIAGRLADRGKTQLATGAALVMGLLSFAIGGFGAAGGVGGVGGVGGIGMSPSAAIAWLLLSAIVLDLGVQANLVLGQRAIYALGAEVRSRLNALYMVTFFLGGAVGSAIASAAYLHGGWTTVALAGAAFPAAALLLFATEGRRGAAAEGGVVAAP